MATPTYTPLANITLGSSAASVTFSSISQAYRDLILVVAGTGASTYALRLRYNSDTGSNYSRVGMGGNGSSTFSFSGSDTSVGLGLWQSTQGNIILQVMDYSAVDKHKTGLSRSNSVNAETIAIAHRWANTSAITTMQIYGESANIDAGTSFALFGVAA